MLESKDVGIESDSVLVVSLIEELEEEGVEEEEGVRVIVGVKTGGHGGKVMDDEDEEEEERVRVSVEREDDGVGKLKVKVEGNSKVMEDGTSGTDV